MITTVSELDRNEVLFNFEKNFYTQISELLLTLDLKNKENEKAWQLCMFCLTSLKLSPEAIEYLAFNSNKNFNIRFTGDQLHFEIQFNSELSESHYLVFEIDQEGSTIETNIAEFIPDRTNFTRFEFQYEHKVRISKLQLFLYLTQFFNYLICLVKNYPVMSLIWFCTLILYFPLIFCIDRNKVTLEYYSNKEITLGETNE